MKSIFNVNLYMNLGGEIKYKNASITEWNKWFFIKFLRKNIINFVKENIFKHSMTYLKSNYKKNCILYKKWIKDSGFRKKFNII